LKSTAILLRPPSAAVDPQMHWLMAGVRDLMAMQSIDDAASSELFHALNEIPLRVTEEVRERGVAMPQAAEVAKVVGALQGMLRDHVRDARSGQFARVQHVLAAISREVGPTKLIALAPAALCDACDFDRALISRIDGSSWVPGVLHIATGASDGAGAGLAEYLAELQIPLKTGLAETEVVRRRTPLLVQDAQRDPRLFRPLIELGATPSYVAAPIIVGDRVIGLLHADSYVSGRPLTSMDRDMVQVFADAFGRAYERAALREWVAQQHDRIRQAFSWTETSMGELDPTMVRLSRSTAIEALPPIDVDRAAVEWRCDRVLTLREQQILTLLATGATNLQIAARLVVSESTVKSHVKRILRKLPAANRAEAVYLFLRMAGRTELQG
jgi:DNA-binding CsgD family transcriptional regulator/GAF domain-containing protein